MVMRYGVSSTRQCAHGGCAVTPANMVTPHKQKKLHEPKLNNGGWEGAGCMAFLATSLRLA